MANDPAITGASTRAPETSVNAAAWTELSADARRAIEETLAIAAGASALVELAQPVDDAHAGRRIALVDDLLALLPDRLQHAIDALDGIDRAIAKVRPVQLGRVGA